MKLTYQNFPFEVFGQAAFELVLTFPSFQLEYNLGTENEVNFSTGVVIMRENDAKEEKYVGHFKQKGHHYSVQVLQAINKYLK